MVAYTKYNYALNHVKPWVLDVLESIIWIMLLLPIVGIIFLLIKPYSKFNF